MALPNEIAVPDEPQAELLRNVERRLQPKTRPTDRRRARSARLIRKMAFTVGLLWMVGLGGALSGSLMASEGFKVDVLQQQLQQATRQQQHLAGLVAAATTPSALAVDAARLHTTVAPTLVRQPGPVATVSRVTLAGRLRATVAGLWRELKRLEAGGKS